MKKLIIILIFFFSQINFGIANTDIVFVDMDIIMNKSKAGVSILNQLKKKNDLISKNFKNDEKKLKDKENKLVAQKNILSDEEFKLNVSKLKLEINDFNKNRNNLINNFNKLKIDYRNKMLKLVNLILIKYSDERSISLILSKKNLVIGIAELDVTDEIIKIVNTEIKEFKIE
tara:strand:- start:114 stop:632 length:519 start_codon:yes stop_codon:yes gene_type:complete